MSSKKVDHAVEFFREGLNCSQAVFGSYLAQFGLEHEKAFRIATAFGGGMRMASPNLIISI